MVENKFQIKFQNRKHALFDHKNLWYNYFYFFQPISGHFWLTDILFFDQLGNISNIRHHIIRNHENIKIFLGTFDYILWYSRLNHITKITCVSVKLRDFANCFRSAPTTYLNFSLSWAQNLMMHKLCKIKNLKKINNLEQNLLIFLKFLFQTHQLSWSEGCSNPFWFS